MQDFPPNLSNATRVRAFLFGIFFWVILTGGINIPLSQAATMEKIYTDPITGIKFVWVDAGCLFIGDDNSSVAAEKPAHEVCEDGFWIGKYEVTQSQWEKIMGHNPSMTIGENFPVVGVSWGDAIDFIDKLNKQSDKRFRLPTEAEWEFAARGGVNSKNYTYSGSNDVEQVAWISTVNNGMLTLGKLNAAGKKKPNELGIYDMSGNAWEWCQDWFDESYYSQSPKNNPKGPNQGTHKVARGGAWLNTAEYVRIPNRGHINIQNYKNSFLASFGLRLISN